MSYRRGAPVRVVRALLTHRVRGTVRGSATEGTHTLYLVMVLHELDNHADVVAVVLDGDDAHDVGGVLGVRVLAVLVGENQAGVRLVNLRIPSGHHRGITDSHVRHPYTQARTLSLLPFVSTMLHSDYLKNSDKQTLNAHV